MFTKYIYSFIYSLIISLNYSSKCGAIVCYKCDSITLEACAMSLDETDLPYVDCKSSLQCVMSIVDSITYRGCSSETPTVGATYKKNCNENLCNKGVYPPGRLKCHHCHEEECNATPTTKPRPCRYHYEYDQCYIEVSNTNKVFRGCKSDTNHTTTPERSSYCDINGCNDQTAITAYKCAQCDSKKGRGCKMDLFELANSSCNITQYETCEVISTIKQNETCFIYHNLDHVMRGCTKNMPEDLKPHTEHILECSGGDLCNLKCLQQQKCLKCDSNINSLCRSNASTILTNYCGSAEISSCYACEYENWQVQRDCGAPPAKETSINRCFECANEDGCNATPFTRCYKCSTANRNPNCASWERPGGNIEIEDCAAPGAKCISAVLEDGLTTVRGCESSYLHCNETLTSCRTCLGSFCNKGAYPANRLRCYQCVGTDNCATTMKQDPMPCALTAFEPINEEIACFQYTDTERGITLGCRSNFAQYYRCILNNDGSECQLCYEDGCNRIGHIS